MKKFLAVMCSAVILQSTLQASSSVRETYQIAKRAMGEIRALATAAEAFATDNNKYPRATSMAGLKALISPTYMRAVPDKDPWGNPYFYAVSADGEQYRFASAGADGRFSEKWDFASRVKVSEEAFEDLNLDMVYENGKFLRYPKAPEPTPEELRIRQAERAEEKRRNPREVTMKEMRTLTVATEAWAIDHDKYPAVFSMQELDALIEPVYVRETPLTDAWDTPFIYGISADGKSIRFISAGPDRALDPDSPNSDDIILENGTLVKPGQSRVRWKQATSSAAAPAGGAQAATSPAVEAAPSPGLDKAGAALVAWANKHSGDKGFISSISEAALENAKEGKNFVVFAGSSFKNDKTPAMLYVWDQTFYPFALSSEQAKNMNLGDGKLVIATRGSRAKVIGPVKASLSAFKLTTSQLGAGSPIAGTVRVAKSEIPRGEVSLRLSYSFSTTGSSSVTVSHYKELKTLPAAGETLKFSFEPFVDPELVKELDWGVPAFVRVDLVTFKERNAVPVSNALVALVDLKKGR